MSGRDMAAASTASASTGETTSTFTDAQKKKLVIGGADQFQLDMKLGPQVNKLDQQNISLWGYTITFSFWPGGNQ